MTATTDSVAAMGAEFKAAGIRALPWPNGADVQQGGQLVSYQYSRDMDGKPVLYVNGQYVDLGVVYILTRHLSPKGRS